MRQVSIIVLLISTIILGTILPSFSAIKGAVEYSIPIDYSKLKEQEIKIKAENFFYNASKLKDNIVNEDLTNAIIHYKVLENINPDKIEYPVKLGILYDKISKDRQAKGYFSKAIGIDNTSPLPYFYLGEFYYKRESYRKALKYYNEAYSRGFESNYDILYRMGDIYEKFGDTRSALKYLYSSQKQNPNPDIESKIKRTELQDSINKEFYSNTRIRK